MAVMMWLPTPRPPVVNWATPLPLRGTAAARTVVPSENLTVPVGAGGAGNRAEAVAVNVTGWPWVVGELDVVSTIDVAAPLSNSAMSLLFWLATATSAKPTLFQSPTVRTAGPASGAGPVLKVCCGAKVPSPLPRSTLMTLLLPVMPTLAVTRSVTPSRSKSPTATETGPSPTATGEPGAWVRSEEHTSELQS